VAVVSVGAVALVEDATDAALVAVVSWAELVSTPRYVVTVTERQQLPMVAFHVMLNVEPSAAYREM
jgi:hypothetical protein